MRHRARAWWGDTWRLWVALVHWNALKTLHVWRGRRRRAPCQDPSDEDLPGRSHCYGIIDWQDPARFRCVCPYLKRGPDGWRCSVASAGVRPFWGRVVAWYAGAAVAAYVGATLLAWGGLRLTGTRGLAWDEVAWPGSWHRIAEVQAQQFFDQSIVAFRQGRLNEAYLALNSACVRDPRHYHARLLMAQIDMFRGNYPYADQSFGGLLAEMPAQAQITAVTYHDTLLSLNRMPELAEFSLAMVARDPAHAALWVRSLLLAVRSGRVAPDFSATHAAMVDKLAPHARLLLQAEVEAGLGRSPQARASLRQPFGGPLNREYMEEQIRALLLLGDSDGAAMLMHYYALAFGDYETQAQSYLIDAEAGDAWQARAYFNALLSGNLTAGRVQRLLVLLIRRPDRDLFRQLDERIRARPALVAAVSGPAMWVAALVCGARPEAEWWRTAGRQSRGDTYPKIERIDFARSRLDEADAVIHVINVVTLPREVIFALLTRVEAKTAPAEAERKRALRQSDG